MSDLWRLSVVSSLAVGEPNKSTYLRTTDVNPVIGIKIISACSIYTHENCFIENLVQLRARNYYRQFPFYT